MTKDNLKTFVERWDGTRPIEVPLPAAAAANEIPKSPSSARVTTKVDDKEKKAKQPKEPKKGGHGRTKNNDVAKSSDFIAPTRSDNDSLLTPNGTPPVPAPATQVPANAAAALNGDIGKATTDPKPAKSEHSVAGAAQKDKSINITKNLLEQLDQIQIKSPTQKQDSTSAEKASSNGMDFLTVENGVSNSATPTSSALSSRGEQNGYCMSSDPFIGCWATLPA